MEEGNIEYKLKLLNPSASRFEHLVTQMKWRLQEGRGEAIYQIGVADCGALKGLSEPELDASLETLSRMAHRLVSNSSENNAISIYFEMQSFLPLIFVHSMLSNFVSASLF